MKNNLWDGMEGDEGDFIHGQRSKYPSYEVNMVPFLMVVNGVVFSVLIGLIYLALKGG